MTGMEVQAKVQRASCWWTTIAVHQPDRETGHWHVTCHKGRRMKKLCLHESLLNHPNLADVLRVQLEDAA